VFLWLLSYFFFWILNVLSDGIVFEYVLIFPTFSKSCSLKSNHYFWWTMCIQLLWRSDIYMVCFISLHWYVHLIDIVWEKCENIWYVYGVLYQFALVCASDWYWEKSIYDIWKANDKGKWYTNRVESDVLQCIWYVQFSINMCENWKIQGMNGYAKR